MTSGRMLYAVVLLCYLLAHRRCGVVQAQQPCSSFDLTALEELKRGLDSTVPADWFSSSSSSSATTECCHWVGITCDFNSRVAELDLSSKGLKGSISAVSLDNLHNLTMLDLSNNSLIGAIPSALFRLPNLRVVQLSLNKFSGAIPVGSGLPSVEIFNISFNGFSGSSSLLLDIFSANLRVLDASNNELDGVVSSSFCSMSPEIEILNLSSNGFSGDFPVGFGACHSLQKLRLDSNYISGNLPDDLFRLKSLREVHLQSNLLTGIVGTGIRNLSNLVDFDVSSNRLSGELPDVFGNLRSLQSFSASSNNISGNLPPSLSTLPSLRVLNMNSNYLIGFGDVSKNFNFGSDLIHLDVGSNRFTGEIPPSIGNCSELKTLNLATNMIHGEIPENFRNLSKLNYLSLSNNSLSNISSSLRILQHCSSLDTLVLDINFRGENLPPEDHGIQPQGFRNLQILAIASSNLSGQIPPWLRNCKKLNVLDLSWNRLIGEISPWFGELNSLFYIDLSHNFLVGELPKSMSNMWSMTFHNTSRLSSSPTPPEYFAFYSKSGRGDDGKIKLYKRLNKIPPSLILRCNNLTGPIWPEFGKLANLHVVDLSRNNLSGSISEELGGIVCLEILDLSYNKLTGTIPSSLSRLSFLSTFEVGYNELIGTIPSGGQFPSFPKSSYEGNLGLCGGGYFPPCRQRQVVSGGHEDADENEDDDGIVAMYGLAFEIGLSFGFLPTFLYMVIRS